MKPIVIIAIAAVVMIGMMVPSAFAQFTDEFSEKLNAESEKSEKDDDYCTFSIRGCQPIYNTQYEINAPNEFIYKSWMGDNSIENIENIAYTFTKVTGAKSFSYTQTTTLKNGVFETVRGNEKLEFGSMFIPPKSPITETNEDFKVKRTNMNFAGMNRDVVYIEIVTSEKTLAGFIEFNDKWYYDWETGLLLKNDFQRTLLDVSGTTNSDRFVQEISAINFSKNNSNGGGCLIATATYGSEMALEVQQLRELRDNTLLNTESGTQFMGMFNDIYYSFSPVIADYERENPLFKEAVKLAITPLISSLSVLNYVDMDSENEVLGYGISLILLNLGMYLGVPAVVIVGIRKRF
jgi:hypothetical protein